MVILSGFSGILIAIVPPAYIIFLIHHASGIKTSKLITGFDFRLVSIYMTATKILHTSKVVKSDPEIIIVVLLSRFSLNP